MIIRNSEDDAVRAKLEKVQDEIEYWKSLGMEDHRVLVRVEEFLEREIENYSSDTGI